MQTSMKRTVLGAMLAGAMLMSVGAPAAWAQISAQPSKEAMKEKAKDKGKEKAKEEAKEHAKEKMNGAKADVAKVGEAAPTFTLKDIDGKEHNLADYKGKTVVLEWFNPECPFVKKHHQANKTMANLYQEYKGKDVVWLAVATGKSASNTSELADAKADYGIAYPIVLDPTGQTGRAYGARTTPHMFVINPEGVLAYAGAIDNSPGAAKLGDVNYVKEALNAVLAGETVATAETKPYGCAVKY